MFSRYFTLGYFGGGYWAKSTGPVVDGAIYANARAQSVFSVSLTTSILLNAGGLSSSILTGSLDAPVVFAAECTSIVTFDASLTTSIDLQADGLAQSGSTATLLTEITLSVLCSSQSLFTGDLVVPVSGSISSDAISDSSLSADLTTQPSASIENPSYGWIEYTTKTGKSTFMRVLDEHAPSLVISVLSGTSRTILEGIPQAGPVPHVPRDLVGDVSLESPRSPVFVYAKRPVQDIELVVNGSRCIDTNCTSNPGEGRLFVKPRTNKLAMVAALFAKAHSDGAV